LENYVDDILTTTNTVEMAISKVEILEEIPRILPKNYDGKTSPGEGLRKAKKSSRKKLIG
jgi:hypothetical protein